jgi:cation diffusion facilitator CzcD-associated flavoprotein CzcO
LSGKRVAVIGTGASAIQIVPAIAERVGKLVLFQRTPAWVLPKPDGAISEQSRARFRRLPVLQWLSRILLYWRLEARVLAMVKRPRLMRHAKRAALQYLKECVPDPALREKLTPRYPIGCKRILMSNDYYQALCRPNAEVVTEPIREVTADGIVTEDGEHRAFDAIVYATGFSVGGSLPFAVRGRGGRTLEEQWQDGAEAYLATSVPGFPNLFLLSGPNSGLGHTSMIFMLESLMAYIVDAVRAMERLGLEQVEVREEVSSAYNALLQGRFPGTVWSKGCKSWYLAKDGRNIAIWPGFTFEFRRRTRRFDAESYLTVSSRKARRAKPLAADKSAPRVPASARAKPVEQTYGQFG